MRVAAFVALHSWRCIRGANVRANLTRTWLLAFASSNFDLSYVLSPVFSLISFFFNSIDIRRWLKETRGCRTISSPSSDVGALNKVYLPVFICLCQSLLSVRSLTLSLFL